MKRKELIIAIDGPAASGKSTTARLVARTLGYLHIDTGAMYRAFTLKVLREGIAPSDTENIARIIAESHVELRQEDTSLSVFLDGENVSGDIRSEKVTRIVSAVSSIKAVRAAMVQEQRRLGRNGGVVLEGRDIGTVVFPDADLKIFMMAGIEERATRRKQELQQQGVEMPVDRLLKEIRERDIQDSTRAESPLIRAEDAILIDTSGLGIEEQVDRVVEEAVKLLKEREQA